jgi:integral membrane protein
MRKSFIIVGWIEGISLLALFFYAMPLKYLYGEPEMVRLIGSAHGGLFMAYIALAFALFDRESWTRKKLLLALILSSVPFGTWIFEKKYL